MNLCTDFEPKTKFVERKQSKKKLTKSEVETSRDKRQRSAIKTDVQGEILLKMMLTLIFGIYIFIF